MMPASRFARRSSLRTLAACSSLLLVVPFSRAADIVSTFDTDADGWTFEANQASNFSWQSSGGNTGGYIQFVDNLNPGSYFVAPQKFLGDWRSLDGSGSLRYDHRIFQEGGDVTNFNSYRVYISGPGGSAFWDGSTPSSVTPWVTQTAMVDRSLWTVESGSWQAILSNVTELRVRGEMVGNEHNPPDIDGIDNVILTAPVPEPASLAALGLGALALLRRRRK